MKRYYSVGNKRVEAVNMDGDETNQQKSDQPTEMTQSQPAMALTINDTLKETWNHVKNNLAAIVGLYFASFLLTLVLVLPGVFIIASTVNTSGDVFDINGLENLNKLIIILAFTAIAVLIVSARVNASIIAAGLKIMRENVQKMSFSEAWSLGKPHFKRSLLITTTYGLIVVIGLMALLIPGVIFLSMYYVAVVSAIDNNSSVGEALKDSKRLTKGKRGWILGIIIVVTVVNGALSAIPLLGQILGLGVGILMMIVPVYVYLALKEQKGDAAKGDTTPPHGTAPQPAQNTPIIPVNDQNLPS